VRNGALNGAFHPHLIVHNPDSSVFFLYELQDNREAAHLPFPKRLALQAGVGQTSRPMGVWLNDRSSLQEIEEAWDALTSNIRVYYYELRKSPADSLVFHHNPPLSLPKVVYRRASGTQARVGGLPIVDADLTDVWPTPEPGGCQFSTYLRINHTNREWIAYHSYPCELDLEPPPLTRLQGFPLAGARFADAFPQLAKFGQGIGVLPLASIRSWARRNASQVSQPIEIVGIRLSYSQLRRGGLIALVFVCLYFLAELEAVRNGVRYLGARQILTPWIPLYSHVMTRALTLSSIVLLPAAILYVLVKSDQFDRVALALASVLVVEGLVGAVICIRIWAHLRPRGHRGGNSGPRNWSRTGRTTLVARGSSAHRRIRRRVTGAG
jgi:hypothetical protein